MKFEKREENVISELSSLYKSYGFKKYKPSSFDEYSLYQQNKDFLIGKNVITFSDLGGRLMAMRPDVTLSLVRHNDVEEGDVEKFYYNEKVYRQSAGRSEYKEISQTGVEVVGKIDEVVVTELSVLICKTLSAVNGDYILDISHMGFTEGLLSEFNKDQETLSEYLKKKNLHDFYKLAKKNNYSEKSVRAFEIAVSGEGTPETVLKNAESVALNDAMLNAVEEIKKLYSALKKFGYGDRMNVNFSAVANADYYNGVIFNGYLKGVPQCVLSGGRYDKLLKKFGKRGGAVGFALYLGEIERYLQKDDEAVDFLIIYDDNSQQKALELAQQEIDSGKSVRLVRKIPENLSYKTELNLSQGVRS